MTRIPRRTHRSTIASATSKSSVNTARPCASVACVSGRPDPRRAVVKWTSNCSSTTSKDISLWLNDSGSARKGSVSLLTCSASVRLCTGEPAQLISGRTVPRSLAVMIPVSTSGSEASIGRRAWPALAPSPMSCRAATSNSCGTKLRHSHSDECQKRGHTKKTLWPLRLLVAPTGLISATAAAAPCTVSKPRRTHWLSFRSVHPRSAGRRGTAGKK